MTQIKICGITNFEDAALAAELGVDAIGFIFYPKTPRFVSFMTACCIIQELGEKRPAVVGVFVNEEAVIIKEAVDFCGLDMIQLHGDESAAYCAQFPRESVIKAVTPAMGKNLSAITDYPVAAFLADRRDAGKFGGTGRTVNWQTARRIMRSGPLILAGGLNESNVHEAISAVRPHAVDLNSGIESAPGRKDAGKMKAIVEIIRGMKDSPSEMNIFAERNQ